MNRRSFFTDLAKGAAAFMILPGAGRLWKPERSIVVPELDPIFKEIWRVNGCRPGIWLQPLWHCEAYDSRYTEEMRLLMAKHRSYSRIGSVAPMKGRLP